MSEKGLQSVAESTSVESGVLFGRHDYALDPKRRLTIPSEWRGVFSGGVVYVMPDRKEKCLNLYPKAEMDSFLGQLRQKALLDPALNRVFSKIGAVSQQLSFDVQGRIRICDKLLQFANLTTTVAMVGSFRMVKLYAPEVLGPEDAVDIAEIDSVLTAAGM
jgi:division/cell wall cluster transcriptional repressor MraZ